MNEFDLRAVEMGRLAQSVESIAQEMKTIREILALTAGIYSTSLMDGSPEAKELAKKIAGLGTAVEQEQTA